MTTRPCEILFLCTGNSARSILGESLLRAIAPHRFSTHSAGSNPTGRVNPFALRVLDEDFGIDASGARSKSVEEVDAVDFDLVITVCDHARDSCPVWPGQTLVAHWGMEDPAAVEGSEEEKLRAFRSTARALQRRLKLLADLPLESLSRQDLQEQIQALADR